MAIQVTIDTAGLVTDARQAAQAVDALTKSQKAQAKAAMTAAKANARSLATFDTLERLKTESASGSGSGGRSGSKAKTKELEKATEKTAGWLTRLEGLWQRLKEAFGQLAAFFTQLGQQLFQGVADAWEAYGQPILEQAGKAMEGVKAILTALWQTIVQPILTSLQAGLAQLWEGHLLPLWNQLTVFLAQLSLTLLTLWNTLLQPLLLWLAETFGPMIGQLGSFIVNAFAASLGALSDFVRVGLELLTAFLDAAQPLAQGLGDCWQGVGETIRAVFQAIWDFGIQAMNGLIGSTNGMIAGVMGALNMVVDLVNGLQLDIPDWVPVYGGRSLGFQLSHLPVPQIPYLATGAVIPPNNPYLAVVGDQRHGTNIETPLETMLDAFRQAQAEQAFSIKFTGDLAQLGRVLAPVLERESLRRGNSLIEEGTW